MILVEREYNIKELVITKEMKEKLKDYGAKSIMILTINKNAEPDSVLATIDRNSGISNSVAYILATHDEFNIEKLYTKLSGVPVIILDKDNNERYINYNKLIKKGWIK